MKIAITGGRGFLGWHTAVRLHAVHGTDADLVGREHFESAASLANALVGSDTVIHLAGVNRAEGDEAVENSNIEIASTLANAISISAEPIHLVYGNSIQSQLDNPYGRGKFRAGEILKEAVRKSGGTFVDAQLPNIFGEHGRPNYNSFVATFCNEIVCGRRPEVIEDRLVSLLHAQGAATVLIDAAINREPVNLLPVGETRLVSEVLGILSDFHKKYTRGQIPALDDAFTIDLFNTYRSYMFPQSFPFKAAVNEDPRGQLFEAVRSHGGTGQTFVSTTAPGMTRGDHFHLSKIERFFVIQGSAEIALRKVQGDEVVRFHVSGKERAFVDMPTMWVHNIRNVGDDDLITLFWADQLLNPAAPDTYWEPVEPGERARL